MIELINVSKTYVTKKGLSVLAIDNISLKFPDKGMVFILGKSGSGKSTLLNLIGGLDKFDSGDMFIKGRSSSDFLQSELDSYRNALIGFIFQDYNILEEFTVGDNISLAIRLQGKSVNIDELNQVLDVVDLAGFSNRKTNELSGGQAQRVAIARALIKQPEIIMADEPTGALDSNSGLQVFETLKKLSNDKLVLIVSHDREYAELYGDRVIELSDGKIISDTQKNYILPVDTSPSFQCIGDDVLHIKKGCQLTIEDLNTINDHLSNTDSEAFISIESGLNKKFCRIANIREDCSRENFSPTDVSKINTNNTPLKLVKSKLPILSAIKIGASNLKHKKIRLAVILFITLIALCSSVFFDTIFSYNGERVLLEHLPKYSTVSFYQSKHFKSQYSSSDSYYYYYTNLKDYDINEIEKNTGIDVTPVYGGNIPTPDDNNSFVTTSYSDDTDLSSAKKLSYRSSFVNDALFSQAVRYDRNFYSNSTNGINMFPYVKDEFEGLIKLSQPELAYLSFDITGRVPTTNKEIAITKFVFDHFTKYGFKDDTVKYSSEQLTNIRAFLSYSPKIVIGNVPFTITGVIDTKFNIDMYPSEYHQSSEYFDYDYDWSGTYHSLLFLAPNVDIHHSLLISLHYIDTYKQNDYPNENTENTDKSFQYFRDGSLNPTGLKTQITEYSSQKYYNFSDNETTRTRLASDEVIVSSAVMTLLNNRAASKNNIIIKYGKVEKYCKIIGYFADTDYGYEVYASDEFFTTYVNYYDLTPKILFAVAKMPTDKNQLKNIASLNFFSGDNSYEIYDPVPRWKVNVSVHDAIRGNVAFSEFLSKIVVWFVIGLILIASLSIMNFIATSINYKQKEIGVLRAVGARGRDVLNIFSSESLIIAIINSILACVFSFFIINYFESLMYLFGGGLVPLIEFKFRQILVI
ncbi:MAG: ATP-binding cassette domain-containing protein, partial [Christensenellaceae bacterium]|nr:ATP-binding cassette domain-containing protein [Christensenellaceae bacterium]